MHPVSRRTALMASLATPLAGFLSGRAYAATQPVDIFSAVASDSRFSTWLALLVQSGLAPYASGANPVTVFVTTNEGFYRLPGVIQELLPTSAASIPDTSNLIRFVRSHVLAGVHPMTEFAGKKIQLLSLAGTPILIDGSKPHAVSVTWTSVEGRDATATITSAPIVCTNGLIYPIDRVVLA